MFNLITIQEIFVSLIVHQVKLLLCKVKFVTYNECAVFFISNISNHPSRDIRKLQSLFKFLFSCTIVNFAEMFNGAVVNIANGIIKNQNEY